MKLFVIIFVSWLPILLSAPLNDDEKDGDNAGEGMCQLPEMMNKFAFDLQQLLSRDDDTNMIFSPYSIFEALAMLNVAAKNNTKKEIGDVLKWSEDVNLLSMLKTKRSEILRRTGNGATLDIANKVWIGKDMNILQSFDKIINDYFNVKVGRQPFSSDAESARKNINEWVGNQTGQMIKDLFPSGSIDSLTKLVLANAIYFKGQWDKPFNPNYTRNGTFSLPDGSNIKGVKFMYKNGEFISSTDRNVQLVELPYEGQSFSMVIAMPMNSAMAWFPAFDEKNKENNPKSIKSIKELNEKMNIDLFNEWSKKLSKNSNSKLSADLYLPKFEIDQDIDLKSHLKMLGARDVFDVKNADLSAITGRRNLYCSSAVHKAYLKVDEKGTTASAATGFGLTYMSLPPQLRINSPFLFFVVHKPCNSIIFSGKIVNPLA